MTQENLEVATALGKELWTTNSFIPRYRCGELGSWRTNPGGRLVNDWGYHSGPCLLEMLPSFSRKTRTREGVDSDAWETWMSLTPHEIESQELGFRYAFDEVAIMGLGMGWMAANCALNPRVSIITIVERDPDVINLPLLIPDEIDYADMIRKVIRNRVARRLPITVGIDNQCSRKASSEDRDS